MCSKLLKLFVTGLAALELPESPTVKAAAGFFVTFISLTGSVESVQEVLRLKGLSLMQCILKAIAWAAPRSYLGSFTDIIVVLNVHCLPLCSQWLEVSVVTTEVYSVHTDGSVGRVLTCHVVGPSLNPGQCFFAFFVRSCYHKMGFLLVM